MPNSEDMQGRPPTVRENVERPEFFRTRSVSDDFGVVEKPLTNWEKLYDNNVARKIFILIILALAWEIYARLLNNELLFPTFTATVKALIAGIVSGGLIGKSWYSVRILLMGYSAGLVLAALLTIFAITSRIGRDFLETVTSMFNPLPAIALLPLALLWFGLGPGSLVFVLIHSVLWAVALNTHSGFQSVSMTLRMVGRNYGLGGLRYVFGILIPAAFPAILSGLKIGWAFAWRTLIAAELVFGVSSGSGGLGWFIYENKNQLEIPSVFAGLLTVILIGLFVENFVFRIIEQRTIRKWGMQE
ncbi:ABC transporter permease subunit [Paralcaligenes sp. KSB-10]|uniref:ABC transporter permease n=1 Tax=Paralcaligenes sp. KSB-10 TaxID=2901142 RepID=UPI001E309EE0|nr:ABC transporter permease subunit [Paralcaligenes sp. KSB-10]UHL62930.1 ABC transporter permease subunit [Paralcaligenes sp. KSB-10]